MEQARIKMQKWFVKVGFGYVGTNHYALIEADTENDAQDQAWELSAENAQSFGFYQDEEVFGDLDTVASNLDEETGEYGQTGSLEYHVEPYIPENHDEYL